VAVLAEDPFDTMYFIVCMITCTTLSKEPALLVSVHTATTSTERILLLEFSSDFDFIGTQCSGLEETNVVFAHHAHPILNINLSSKTVILDITPMHRYN
jgi:hypothetical protein